MEQAKEDMKALTQYRTECQYGEANFEEYDTFLEYERTAHDELYLRAYLIGRFIQVEDLADDRDLAELITSIEDVPVEYMSCNCILVGGRGLMHWFYGVFTLSDNENENDSDNENDNYGCTIICRTLHTAPRQITTRIPIEFCTLVISLGISLVLGVAQCR